MNAKEMAAEIKRVGLLRAGNLQDELNALAIKLEDEVTDLRTKNSALQLSQDNIINGLGITGDGPVSKSVIEYVMGLVAENAVLKTFIIDECFIPSQFGDDKDAADFMPASPATDDAIAEIKASGRIEGVIFTANRMLVAWEHGFINASETEVADITGAVLGMLEFLPKAESSELTREYADEVRARIAANLRAWRKG